MRIKKKKIELFGFKDPINIKGALDAIKNK